MPVFRRYAPLKNTMDSIVVTRLKAKLIFPFRKIQTRTSATCSSLDHRIHTKLRGTFGDEAAIDRVGKLLEVLAQTLAGIGTVGAEILAYMQGDGSASHLWASAGGAILLARLQRPHEQRPAKGTS